MLYKSSADLGQHAKSTPRRRFDIAKNLSLDLGQNDKTQKWARPGQNGKSRAPQRRAKILDILLSSLSVGARGALQILAHYSGVQPAAQPRLVAREGLASRHAPSHRA